MGTSLTAASHHTCGKIGFVKFQFAEFKVENECSSVSIEALCLRSPYDFSLLCINNQSYCLSLRRQQSAEEVAVDILYSLLLNKAAD